MSNASEDFDRRRSVVARPALIWLRRLRFASDPEKLIAVGRLVTSLFAAIAIYLDPTQPARSLAEVQAILGAYLLFALALVLRPAQLPIDSNVHVVTHAIDIFVLGWLAFLTDELTSPFFAFLPFILLATTMRWGMRGAVFGAIALEAVLLVIGWPDLEDGESELNILLMRSAYFLVAAGMLGYFGGYRDRSRHRLARLASWPFAPPTNEQQSWLQGILDHAADVLGASQLIVLWQQQDGTAGTLAIWQEGQLHLTDVEDTQPWAAWSDGLHHKSLRSQNRASQRDSIEAISGALRELGHPHRPIEHVRSAAFSTIQYQGWLLVINARHRHEEGVSLSEIIATRIGHELERLSLMHEVSSNARFQERVRLARDLHDSVLQDLTAASLKLKAATALVPPEAQPPLRSVSALMLDQQRRIRLFVENARTADALEQVPLAPALAASVQTLREQWGCDIHLTISAGDLDVPARFLAEVIQLISEATANAVRHGRATRIDLAVGRQAGRFRLEITDNGRGITTPGKDERQGSISLGTRVAGMAGSLSITRFSPGLAMLIELPVL
jgi:signal transduction histidine kinase